MHFKRFPLPAVLAVCGLAGHLHAATPEAAMNAARVPDADNIVVINVANINAAPFAKDLLAFFEKITALTMRDDENFDALLAAFKTENISLADIKAITYSMNAAKIKEEFQKQMEALERALKDEDRAAVEKIEASMISDVLFAIQLEKPLNMESLKKLLGAMRKMMAPWHFDRDDVVVTDKSIVINGRSSATLLADGKVVFYGTEAAVKAAEERAEANKRADDLPAMKKLQDEKFARCDAYFIMIPPASEREDALDSFPLFWFLLDDMPESVEDAAETLNALTLGVDVTDKASATLSLLFDAPEPAATFGGFLSAVGVAKMKMGLYNVIEINLPFMDSLKASTTGNTVSLTCELTAKDIELLLPIIEKFAEEEEARNKNMRINANRASIRAIETAIQTFEIMTGNYPKSVEELTAPIGDRQPLLQTRMLNDAWGTPFQIKFANDTFEIRSAGPDKKFGTEDDITN